MKASFEDLRGHGLSGKFGFAFDKKRDTPLSGNAAKSMEKEQRNPGPELLEPSESVAVFLEKGSTSGEWLKEGEERRFELVGRNVRAVFSTWLGVFPA